MNGMNSSDAVSRIDFSFAWSLRVGLAVTPSVYLVARTHVSKCFLRVQEAVFLNFGDQNSVICQFVIAHQSKLVMTERETVLAAITAQGDVVRSLKAAKAEKSKVSNLRYTTKLKEWGLEENSLIESRQVTCPRFDNVDSILICTWFCWGLQVSAERGRHDSGPEPVHLHLQKVKNGLRCQAYFHDL